MTSTAFCTDLAFSSGALITWLGFAHVIFVAGRPLCCTLIERPPLGSIRGPNRL
jgi:hypothetical protein